MTKLIPILLLLACSSTPTTYNQSAFRLPPRTPVFSPAEDAPHTFVPGPQRKPDVQPNPKHKRVLPQTPETAERDGIWAGDDPDSKYFRVTINSQVILYPWIKLEEDMEPARRCEKALNAVFTFWPTLKSRVNELYRDDRDCAVWFALEYCLRAPPPKGDDALYIARAEKLRDDAIKIKPERCKKLNLSQLRDPLHEGLSHYFYGVTND